MSNTQGSRGRDYERLVSRLIDGLRTGANLSNFELGAGSKNRIEGASGYKHQIDVSLLGPSDLFMFEAKCLKRVVGVQEILVMSSRLVDISATFPSHRVYATIISEKHISKNAKTLATHFNINTDWVKDVKNFGVSFAKHHIVASEEILLAKSTMEFREIKPI